MMELEEGSGTEASDTELLERCHFGEVEDHERYVEYMVWNLCREYILRIKND